MNETDKIVTIAWFQDAIKAHQLVELLKAEGIDSFVSNEYSAEIMRIYADLGGVRVETLESNVPQAMQIMEAFGYDIPSENDLQDQRVRNNGFFSLSFDKQILAVLLLVILCFGLLYLYYNFCR